MMCGTPQTPQGYLAAAAAAFAGGDYDGGSELLYQSAACALSEVARDYGQPAGTRAELRAFARWLDDKHNTGRWHTRKLGTALTISDNAGLHFLQPDDIDIGRPSVEEFVATLVSYRKTGGGSP